MRVGRSIPFNWDTSIYRKPIRVVAPTPLAMSAQERAEYDSILHRKAVDKLHRITNGEPLEMDELEELCMLIVRADPEDSNQYPFWVAEVGKIDNDRNSTTYNMVQVCWFTPIKRGKNQLTRMQHTHRQERQAGRSQTNQTCCRLDWFAHNSSCVLPFAKWG